MREEFLNLAPLAAFEIDRNDRILWINAKAEQLLNCKADELQHREDKFTSLLRNGIISDRACQLGACATRAYGTIETKEKRFVPVEITQYTEGDKTWVFCRDIRVAHKIERKLNINDDFYVGRLFRLRIPAIRKKLAPSSSGRPHEIVEVNEAFCAFSGVSPDAAITFKEKNDFDFYEKPLAEQYQLDDSRIAKTRSSLEMIEQNKGNIVHVIKVPIFRKGDVVEVLCLFWKVEDREHALQQFRNEEMEYHDLLKSIVDEIPIPLYRKNTSGAFVFASRRFCQQEGYSIWDIIGKSDGDLFPEQTAAKYADADKLVMDSGFPMELVEPHPLRNGKVLTVRVVKTPICAADSPVVGLQGIFWDITEEQKRERQLNELNQALAQSRYRLQEITQKLAATCLPATVPHDLVKPLQRMLTSLAEVDVKIAKGDLESVIESIRAVRSFCEQGVKEYSRLRDIAIGHPILLCNNVEVKPFLTLAFRSACLFILSGTDTLIPPKARELPDLEIESGLEDVENPTIVSDETLLLIAFRLILQMQLKPPLPAE